MQGLEADRASTTATGGLGARFVASMWQGPPSKGRREAPASSLEEGTLSDSLRGGAGLHHTGEGWSVTCFEFAPGVVEVRAHRVGSGCSPPRRRDRKADSVSPFGEVERTAGERFESSTRRAKQGVQRRCMALDADHLLTLTKRGKFESIDDAWVVFERFNRYMRRMFRARWRYVCVPEQHADGSYHLHVAIKGFFWVGLLRKLWARALGGSGEETGSATLGNIDIRSFVAVRGRTRRVARYIAKYVGKGFSALDRGRRAYSCSPGLLPLRITRWREPIHCGRSDVAASIQRRVGDALSVPGWDSWFWADGGRSGFILYSR